MTVTPAPTDSGSLDLEEIEARANAATAGPWQKHSSDGHKIYVASDELTTVAQVFKGDRQIADAYFIAASRTDIPALLAALATATSHRDRLAEALRKAPDPNKLRTFGEAVYVDWFHLVRNEVLKPARIDSALPEEKTDG